MINTFPRACRTCGAVYALDRAGELVTYQRKSDRERRVTETTASPATIWWECPFCGVGEGIAR